MVDYLRLFSEKMYSFRKEIWAVYGTGETGLAFLRELPEFNFIGIIRKKDCLIYGNREWTLDEAHQLRVKYIVLAEQLISQKDEFLSLCDFCKNYCINLIDIYGNDLLDILHYVELVADSAGVQNKAALKACIDEHEIISFDIFDTLLMRKTLYPEDVFELVEERAGKKGIEITDFREKRVYAQLNNGLDNPDLDEIYNSFQQLYGISEKDKEILKYTELDVEKAVLIPRNDMVELFNHAVDSGKKVYLISDMYITGTEIAEILDAVGVRGYQGIWVSCDHKQLKLEGLFGTFKESVKGGSYLHIGDSRIHDGICAKAFNIDCRLVNKATDMLQQNFFFRGMPELKSLNDRSLVGLCIASLFNSPFQIVEGKRHIHVRELEQVGYCFIAPVVAVIVTWLVRKVEEEKPENVLFASRDGYLIMKLYRFALKKLNKSLPAGTYFYTSRKAAVLARADEEAVITMLIDNSLDMPPEKILQERFGVKKESIRPYHQEEYESVHHYVWAHKEEILLNATRAKQNYFKYMGKLNLKIGRQYMFYDFVSSGTCQKALQKYVPFTIKGAYCGWNGAERAEDFCVQSIYDQDSLFCQHFRFMELFMTSDEPSLKEFSDAGDPVFGEESRTQEEMDDITRVQNAIGEFVEDYLENLYQDGKTVMSEIAAFLYECFFDVVLEAEAESVEKLILWDDWKDGMLYESTLKGE